MPEVWEATRVMARGHANGTIAEVMRQPDGRYVAQVRAGGCAAVVGLGLDLAQAQRQADSMAHHGCDSRRCGAWAESGES
jgi:hypothetical protein